MFELLSEDQNEALRKKVKTDASKKGLTYIKDDSGTNINVQVIDTEKIDFDLTTYSIKNSNKEKPVIIVMDYAFGEQAYETMDELLKPYKISKKETQFLDVSRYQLWVKQVF